MTIKEFAAAVDMTTQGIYRHIDGKLKDYVETIDNKKMINKSALSLFESKDSRESVDNKLIEFLQNELEYVKEQVKEKDRQIKEKDQQIKEKDKQIAELQANENRFFVFYATSQQRIRELEDRQKVVEVAEPEPEKKHRWKFWR